MTFKELEKQYDKLQLIYGDPTLHSIYNGGCRKNPDICFVFMNPTGKNISSLPEWKGPHYPWLGTKNIWDLFKEVNLIDEDIYLKIKEIKPNNWTPEFCEEVYKNIEDHKVYITNLGKCTQLDARPLKDNFFKDYLPLLEEEIKLINPKVIILFGNQVSSIFLRKTISVSQVRKELFLHNIDGKEYKTFSVFYPVGNGRFNIPKSIEDIKYIIDNYVGEK